MSNRKKQSLPFDKAGGVIAIQKRMFSNKNYLLLSAQSKVLMMLMQTHWRNEKPVDYGVREASKNIPCAFDTARKSFNQLQDSGFIEMIDPSIFCSRTESKSRTWRLTWMPFNFEKPTNDWEKQGKVKYDVRNLTDLKMIPLEGHRPKYDASGNSVNSHRPKYDASGSENQ